MARVVWPLATVNAINDILAYIEPIDAAAAARVCRRLFELGDSLQDFPQRGRIGPDGTRELTGVPPYILRDRVIGDDVVIVDVRHGARAPQD